MMNRKHLPQLALTGSLIFLAAGCKSKQIDDTTLNTNVHTALAADATIAKQPIQTATVNGVVTLTGNVSDDTASAVAAQDAARVEGVKEVVNNLSVAGIAVTPTITSPTAPTEARTATRQEQVTIASKQPLPPPPAAAPAPPKPVIRTATAAAGTSLPVRITEALSSGQTPEGATFHGVVTRSIVNNGLVVIPAGSAVSGRVVAVKDAAHFKGSSLLSITLTAVRRHGDLISIQTAPYTLQGQGRGKNTAVKVGGGAGGGALLGGLLGGGKGALIGGLVGAGGGTAWQAATKGQQVSIASESVVRFRLTAPVSVQTTDSAADDANADDGTDASAPATSTGALQTR